MWLNFLFISSCKQKYSFIMKKWTFTKFGQFQFEFFYQLITGYQVKIKKVQFLRLKCYFWTRDNFLDPRQFSGPATFYPRPATFYLRPATFYPRPATFYPRPATINPRPATIYPRPATRDPRPATRDPRPATRDPRPATRETLARQPD